MPQAFNEKPVAIMGASGGKLGTARAQYHLRQVLVFLNAHVINKPEVMVGGAASAFADGKLTDETARDLIRQQLEALQVLAKKVA
jgi:chromate reductase